MEVDANRVIEKLVQEIGQLRLQLAILQAQIEQMAESGPIVKDKPVGKE